LLQLLQIDFWIGGNLTEKSSSRPASGLEKKYSHLHMKTPQRFALTDSNSVKYFLFNISMLYLWRVGQESQHLSVPSEHRKMAQNLAYSAQLNKTFRSGMAANPDLRASHFSYSKS
jgi:hypothetical protein